MPVRYADRVAARSSGRRDGETADDRRLHVTWCITPPLAIVTELA
jgi:hypothetical protein